MCQIDIIEVTEKLAYKLKAKFYADRRADILASLVPTSPTVAWIVCTRLPSGRFDTTNSSRRNLKSSLADLINQGLEIEMEVSEVQIHTSLAQKQLNSVGHVEHASFRNPELASALASYIYGAQSPKAVPFEEAATIVDLYREQILDGKRPFTVLFQDGELIEVKGSGNPFEVEITTIDEFTFLKGKHKSMSGTVWAWDFNDAIREGKEIWDRFALDAQD